MPDESGATANTSVSVGACRPAGNPRHHRSLTAVSFRGHEDNASSLRCGGETVLFARESLLRVTAGSDEVSIKTLT